MPAMDAQPSNLKEACQEFESIFIGQMMAAMRNSVPESKLFGDSSGQKIFRQMLDQEQARNIAYSGGFGIGDMLYNQLHRLNDDEDEGIVEDQEI